MSAIGAPPSLLRRRTCCGHLRRSPRGRSVRLLANVGDDRHFGNMTSRSAGSRLARVRPFHSSRQRGAGGSLSIRRARPSLSPTTLAMARRYHAVRGAVPTDHRAVGSFDLGPIGRTFRAPCHVYPPISAGRPLLPPQRPDHALGKRPRPSGAIAPAGCAGFPGLLAVMTACSRCAGWARFSAGRRFGDASAIAAEYGLKHDQSVANITWRSDWALQQAMARRFRSTHK